MNKIGQMETKVKHMKSASQDKKIKQFPCSGFETTDLSLFVRTSEEDLVTWDRRKIVEALTRETYVDPDTADLISKGQVCGFRTMGYIRIFFIVMHNQLIHIVKGHPQARMHQSCPFQSVFDQFGIHHLTDERGCNDLYP